MSQTETLHATCVALDRDRGLLVLGPSGSGKSALGLQLMAMGAHLIADDQTTLTVTDAGLVASCPSPIAGVIEARGIGLLTATPLAMARVTLVVDLGQTESDRLPPFRSVTLLGTALPLVLGQKSPHFPAALLCYLQGGRYG